MAALAIVLLAACGLDPRPADFPDAPQAVRDRPALPACGRETNVHGAGASIAGRTCFWDAYLAGRPAEFISTITTIEGDPVTFIYRVLAGGQVEVFIDATKDSFGSGKWSRLECQRLEPLDGAQVEPDWGPADCVEDLLD